MSVAATLTCGNPRRLLIAVALGSALAPLNSTMIMVALPGLLNDFGAGLADGAWLFIAYLIAMAALQPLGGTLGDRFGRRRLVLAGLSGFGLASLGATLAPNLLLLTALRTVQAVSGAVIIPNGTALLRELIPAEKRAEAFGLVGVGIGLAAATGPSLGGLLTSLIGWRALFAVNLLLVAPALILGWSSIPRSSTVRRADPFDLVGAITLPLLLLGLAVLLGGGRSGLTAEPWLAGPLLLLAALFGWWEWRQRSPILQPRFFGRRAFAAANLAVAAGNFAMYVVLLALPLLLAGAETGTLTTGLALAALAIAMTLTAPFGGRLADTLGRRAPATFGHLLLAGALLPLALTGGLMALAPLFATLALAGIGLGLTQASVQAAAVEAVDQDSAGSAAGVFSTSRYLGSIVGSSLLSPLLSGPGGFGAVFTLCTGAALVAALPCLGLPARR